MVLLGDPDVGRSVEKALERNARLQASERRAGARVKAATKPNMVAHAGALELELVGLIEVPRITAYRAESDCHECARRELDAAD